MKHHAFVFALFASSLALASVPSQPMALKIHNQVLETLALPEANRYLVADRNPDTYYPALIEISKSAQQTLQLRWKALTLAAHLKKEKSLKDLEAALAAPEWYMRNAALVAINSFSPQRAQREAKVLIKDKAMVVRSAAVEMLGSDLDTETRDLLWEELNANYNFRKKQGLWIRQQILNQLAMRPKRKELPLFLNALKEKDQSIHFAAIAGIENLSGQRLGKKNDTLATKRDLWIKWAKANSDSLTR